MAMDLDSATLGELQLRGRLCLGSQLNGSMQVVTSDGNFTVNDNAAVVLITATLGAKRTATGPKNPKPGQVIIIKNGGTGNYAVTFAPQSGTIDGASTADVVAATSMSAARLVFDGTNWWTF